MHKRFLWSSTLFCALLSMFNLYAVCQDPSYLGYLGGLLSPISDNIKNKFLQHQRHDPMPPNHEHSQFQNPWNMHHKRQNGQCPGSNYDNKYIHDSNRNSGHMGNNLDPGFYSSQARCPMSGRPRLSTRPPFPGDYPVSHTLNPGFQPSGCFDTSLQTFPGDVLPFPGNPSSLRPGILDPGFDTFPGPGMDGLDSCCPGFPPSPSADPYNPSWPPSTSTSFPNGNFRENFPYPVGGMPRPDHYLDRENMMQNFRDPNINPNCLYSKGPLDPHNTISYDSARAQNSQDALGYSGVYANMPNPHSGVHDPVKAITDEMMSNFLKDRGSQFLGGCERQEICEKYKRKYYLDKRTPSIYYDKDGVPWNYLTRVEDNNEFKLSWRLKTEKDKDLGCTSCSDRGIYIVTINHHTNKCAVLDEEEMNMISKYLFHDAPYMPSTEIRKPGIICDIYKGFIISDTKVGRYKPNILFKCRFSEMFIIFDGETYVWSSGGIEGYYKLFTLQTFGIIFEPPEHSSVLSMSYYRNSNVQFEAGPKRLINQVYTNTIKHIMLNVNTDTIDCVYKLDPMETMTFKVTRPACILLYLFKKRGLIHIDISGYLSKECLRSVT